MASIIPQFSANRMVEEYKKRFYQKAIEDARYLNSEDFSGLYQLLEAKNRISENWESISYVDVNMDGFQDERITIGQPIIINIELSHPNLLANDINVQVALTKFMKTDDEDNFRVFAMNPTEEDKITSTSSWQIEIASDQAGPHGLGIRVVPKNYSHNLVKWL